MHSTHEDKAVPPAPGAIDLVLLGLPKTGTTWLASVLAHTGSLALFDESDKIERLWQRQERRPVLIAESATDPLFLGAIERRPQALAALAARLRARRYALVLREPGDWVISLYRQYLKRGGTLPFRRFVGSDAAAVVDPAYADYGRLVNEAGSALDGALAVCSYERLRTDPRGFIDDIDRAFDRRLLAVEDAAALPPRLLASRANVGVRGLGARIVRGVNRVRRTPRWNPDGWVSWKRFERLPWHWLGGIGTDVIDADDRRWLAERLAAHADWERWSNEFAAHPVILHA